jgi:hypothetical protein
MHLLISLFHYGPVDKEITFSLVTELTCSISTPQSIQELTSSNTTVLL